MVIRACARALRPRAGPNPGRGLRRPHSATTTKASEAFPWFTCLPTASSVSPGLLSDLRLWFALDMCQTSREAFLEATRVAFCQAARSAFGGRATTPLGLEEAGGHPPPLDSMMEARLARIFARRLETLRQNGKEASLELLSVEPQRVAWCDLLLSPDRAAPLADVYYRYTFGPFTIVGRPPTPLEEQATKWWQSRTVQAPYQRVRVQVAVDFECEERFLVRDTATGNLLQGKDRVQSVEHRVVFEMDLGTPQDFHSKARALLTGSLRQEDFVEGASWAIVDVDQMLGGYGYQFLAADAKLEGGSPRVEVVGSHRDSEQ